MEPIIKQREHEQMQTQPLNSLPVNINWPERIFSITTGARIAAGGLSRLTKNPLTGLIITAAGGYLLYRGLTGNCPLYARLAAIQKGKPDNINIKTTMVVKRPRHEVYGSWRRLENLPFFMSHLDSVTSVDNKHSHWEAKLPGKVAKVSWDAEIVSDEPGRLIAWKSVEGSAIDNAGRIEFVDAPGSGSTVVKVVFSYIPPVSGTIAEGAAKLLSPALEKIIKDDIHSFKQYIESSSLSV
ncbi:MAG: hypothetical protein JWN56_418 [Sphingobacteriales bacterium]|nr:hypothetical protein [Sphingobacteriales bacterium]